jgi:hypothetical protein
MSDPRKPQIMRATRILPANRTQELIDLAGGSVDQSGKKFSVISGQITHFDETTNEARGDLTLQSPSRLSLLAGRIKISIHHLEFEVQMLKSIVSPTRGEVSVRFVAWLRPSIKAIKHDADALRELVQG